MSILRNKMDTFHPGDRVEVKVRISQCGIERTEWMHGAVLGFTSKRIRVALDGVPVNSLHHPLDVQTAEAA